MNDALTSVIKNTHVLATVFLELWRRKQSVIQWEWDLQGTEQDEEPRPGCAIILLYLLKEQLIFRAFQSSKRASKHLERIQ